MGTDTLLVIEVSDTTLGYDRDGKYERHVALERPAGVAVARLPGVTLDVAPLFPR